MMNRQRSTRFERNPSIRQLFPPKTSDDSTSTSQEAWDTINGSYNSQPLLLPDVPQKNVASIASSPKLQRAVTLRVYTEQPSNSNAFHVDDQFADASRPCPETASGSNLSPRDGIPMNLNLYVPLYRAALKGDWEEAQAFLNVHPGAQRARITKGRETALHIAAGARHTKFVEELVKVMSAKDIEMQNSDDNTALCFGAASGITKIAEAMVKKNKDLACIRGSLGVTPLYMATLLGHSDMVWYLYSVTDDEHLTFEDFFGLLVAAITTDLYDFALHILWLRPNLAMHRSRNGDMALHVLARKPSAFFSGNRLGIWEECIYPWIHVELHNKSTQPSSGNKCRGHMNTQGVTSLRGLVWHAVKLLVPGVNKVYTKKVLNMEAVELVKCQWEEIKAQNESQCGDLLRSPSDPLLIAAEFGIVEFVAVLVYSYPDLIWKVDNQNRSLFHIAVMHRHEKIFSLIYNIGAHKDLITSYKDGNNHNMLHLAGKLAPANLLNNVSGAALQMQRELLWFKEVEKIIQPLYKEMMDSKGRTPQMLFTEEHKGLVKDGEKWMKNTASSCMLVSTLITTVMFAAIFTVPGANNNDNGIPILLRAKAFHVFALSDAFALFSSVTSVLIFLSVLTSRYAEEDFLKSLPKRLSVGMAALFLSIVSMLISFSATFFLVVSHQWAWIVMPVALIACVPGTFFAFLQFPLLVDTVRSTYGAGIFSQSRYKIY
ncbi:Ankyrin repeat-containing protein [Actinidia chinensis var. chinensis]|uniref:Ankyrin repeat-containing protein n=1 Tax=Actinidia chinensis var. chinensis TaxID=1590841 RepID=A0A2R6QMF9_ACTCC|nr:Ankyrin repeat-containing protein [Actinidia chinensis var. chinensis]